MINWLPSESASTLVSIEFPYGTMSFFDVKEFKTSPNLHVNIKAEYIYRKRAVKHSMTLFFYHF